MTFKPSECWDDPEGGGIWKAGADMTTAEVVAAVRHERVCNQGGCQRVWQDGVYWARDIDVQMVLAAEFEAVHGELKLLREQIHMLATANRWCESAAARSLAVLDGQPGGEGS